MSLRTKSLNIGHMYIHIIQGVSLNAVTLVCEYCLTSRDDKICLLIADSQFMFDQSPTDASIKLAANLIPTALISTD